MEKIGTIIIGGGQAGLSTSYYLNQLGHEHLVLEQASQAGNAWRNDRWDSFALLTPNWSIKLPGTSYRGNNPDGFMPRAELVSYFEKYEDGYPIQQRGVTQYPGLYFIGMSWLYKQKSPLLMGVGEDAEYIVSHLTK